MDRIENRLLLLLLLWALALVQRVICIYRVGAELFGGVRGLSELMSCSVTSLTIPGGVSRPSLFVLLESFSLSLSLFLLKQQV